MIINHNLSALMSSRMNNKVDSSIQKDIRKLSSGERINSASEDASGLAVSEKMRSQIRGLNQANKNIQNGISFVGVTEGYLQETTDILQRIRELAVQSSNGIYSNEDRENICVEVSQLVAEVDRIASQAQFNGMNILTGSFAKEGSKVMQFQVGANMDQNLKVYIGTMTSQALGLKEIQDNESIISLADPETSNRAIGTIDEALKKVTKQRADLGGYQNRLEKASEGVKIASENLTASESRIRDTDFAAAVVEYTKNQILSETSAAMLAQASSQNKIVLSLLR